MNVVKYSANGNDFVIFHSFVKKRRNELAKEICDRQNGIGADGLIVLVPNTSYDFEWEFYNSDGSDAKMCGNGSRACAHYAFFNNLAPKQMRFLTPAGVISAFVEDNTVTSELTPPIVLDKNIMHNGVSWWKIDTGVPHLVSFVKDINMFDLQEAKALRDKYNANVNVASIDKGGLHVRTYERGVEDETLACGTGMAASFYRGYIQGLLQADTDVFPASNDNLKLSIKDNVIYFTGDVKRVFSADYNPAASTNLA